MSDDGAATPVSDVSLTPPSPHLFPPAFPAPTGVEPSEPLAPRGLDTSEPLAPRALNTSSTPRTALDELFASLDAQRDSTETPRPRRGRPPRVFAALDSLAQRPAADSGAEVHAPADGSSDLDVHLGVGAPVGGVLVHVGVEHPTDGALAVPCDSEGAIHLAVRDGYATASVLTADVCTRVEALARAPQEVTANVKQLCIDKVQKGVYIGLMADAEARGLDYRTFRSALHRWSCIFLMVAYRLRMLFESFLADNWLNRVV